MSGGFAAAPVSRSLWSGIQSILLPTITALLFLAFWEFAVRLLDVPRTILPAPSDVMLIFFGPKASLLIEHAIPTGTQTLVGFLLAASLGYLTAISLVYSAIWRDAIYPYLVAFQVIPKIALAPLFTVTLGLGSLSQIAFILFIAFFPVVTSLTTGLSNTDRDVIRLCQSLNATTTQTIFQVRLPYALGYLFAGLKIASTMAVIGVVVGEFISSKVGLAYLILNAASRLEMAFVMAAILVIVMIGLVLYGAVVLAEMAARRWLERTR